MFFVSTWRTINIPHCAMMVEHNIKLKDYSLIAILTPISRYDKKLKHS